MVEIRFTLPFKRRNLKDLIKHYRQIQTDIHPIIE